MAEVKHNTKRKRRKKTHYEKGECYGCMYRSFGGSKSVCNYYLETNSRISVNSKGRCVSKKKIEWEED